MRTHKSCVGFSVSDGVEPLAVLLDEAGVHVDRVLVLVEVGQGVHPVDDLVGDELALLHREELFARGQLVLPDRLVAERAERGEAPVRERDDELRPSTRSDA